MKTKKKENLLFHASELSLHYERGHFVFHFACRFVFHWCLERKTIPNISFENLENKLI